MRKRFELRSFVALLAMAVLSASAAGCGGADQGRHAQVQPSSGSVASATVSTASSAASEGAQPPPQNDDYISTYGSEAGPAQKRAIEALVHRYYAAVIAGDGTTGCSLLYATLAKSVPEDYGQSPGGQQRRGMCAVVLSRLFEHIPGHSTADLASTKITGVRLRGDRGFVQLSSVAMPTGEIFVEREGRLWKIGALIGRACRNCAAR